jgi:RNA polymerase sigma-70 factor (ECF subfamily)
LALDDPNLDRTSKTLLRRLGDPGDKEAWSQFEKKYAPMIYGWCKRLGAQAADAEDVIQEVMSRLYKSMSTFVYQPRKGRYRGWLKTVTENAWKDYVSDLKRSVQGAGDSEQLEWLNRVPDDDLAREFERQYDLEMLEVVKEKALQRAEVTDRDWEIFCCLVKKEMTGAQLAARFHTTVGAVYMAKKRVQEKVQVIAQELEDAWAEKGKR